MKVLKEWPEPNKQKTVAATLTHTALLKRRKITPAKRK